MSEHTLSAAIDDLDDRTADLVLEATDLKRRVADLELAVRALAPSLDVKPGEARLRLETLERIVAALHDRLEVLEGGDER
jgi:hypothetical protein